MTPPTRIQINAYDPAGTPSSAEFDLQARIVKKYALTPIGQPPRAFLAPAAPIDLSDWRHPDVGWGVVVSNRWTTLPAPLRELVAARKAPVLRFIHEWDRRFTYLRNEELGRDVAIAGSPRGTGPGRLPQYLLICGTPEDVPWRLQFALSANRSVGRLPLGDEALRNYVQAVLTDFPGAADPRTTLTWAVDLGASDITNLMRTHIAAKVHAAYNGDTEIGSNRATFLDGHADPDAATAAAFASAVATRKPGTIVTTSHGLTTPLENAAALRENLGLPVDQRGASITVRLLDGWEPNGAIWYCHACCSAGAEAPSAFAALFEPDTSLHRILSGIASAGSMVAPLPLHLLGHTRPCRAFIGHVEPTFDWTLRNPGNRQVVTQPIVDALHQQLFRPTPPMPCGLAFRDVYSKIGEYLAVWDNARADYDAGARNVDDLLALQLAARDLQALVILGDPAMALPLA